MTVTGGYRLEHCRKTSRETDVTVVIPVRKGGMASLTLETLEAQTVQNFAITLVHDDNEQGAAFCRNRGFDAAETPLVLFSDDDIKWKPDALERMLTALDKDFDASFAWGSYNCGGYLIGKPEGGKQWDVTRLQRKNYISSMALWRKSHFIGWDEGLKRLQDWDLYLRVAQMGHHGAYAGNLFTTEIGAGHISSNQQIKWQPSHDLIVFKHRSPLVDIILPCYLVNDDLVKDTRRCIESIRQNTGDYRLILIDNGSENWWQLQDALIGIPYLIIRNSENRGFVKAVNQGFQLSNAPYVVLLNNDTVVGANWLENLQKPLLQDPSVGAAGPRTDTTASWQGRDNGRKGRRWIQLNHRQMLAFFCVLIRRRCLEDVGGLDESFGIGFGDDDDWCVRAHRKGWKLIYVRDSFVSHRHRSTFKALWEKEQIQNMQENAFERLKDKYPEMVSESP